MQSCKKGSYTPVSVEIFAYDARCNSVLNIIRTPFHMETASTSQKTIFSRRYRSYWLTEINISAVRILAILKVC